MEKQEILAAFLQAEKDWSEPIEKSRENDTSSGLCPYFTRKIGLNDDEVNSLRLVWIRQKTKVGVYDFHGRGDTSRGRAERLEAIRKVINDLKKES